MAVAVLTDLSLAMMLVWFGVFQIVWGLYYGVPISVEPMKAVGALVIAETGLGLGSENLLLAGLASGLAVAVIGLGYWNLSAFAVLFLGAVIAGFSTGGPRHRSRALEGCYYLDWRTSPFRRSRQPERSWR